MDLTKNPQVLIGSGNSSTSANEAISDRIKWIKILNLEEVEIWVWLNILDRNKQHVIMIPRTASNISKRHTVFWAGKLVPQFCFERRNEFSGPLSGSCLQFSTMIPMLSHDHFEHFLSNIFLLPIACVACFQFGELCARAHTVEYIL